MLAVAQAIPSMFEDILILLRQFNNTSISDSDWLNFINYPWRHPEDAPAFVLLNSNRVVGVLGTIFSRQRVGVREQLFCNLSSWWVEPAHRSQGAYLIREVLSLQNCVITNLSASLPVAAGLRKLGFKDLETKAYLSPPAWCLPGRTRAVVHSIPERVAELVGEEGRRIITDHRPYRCHHLAISTPKGICHVTFTLKSSRLGKLATLHYVSDASLLVEGKIALARHLAWYFHSPRFLIESRLLQGQSLEGAKEVPTSTKLYLAPAEILPGSISNLYTEMVMLGL